VVTPPHAIPHTGPFQGSKESSKIPYESSSWQIKGGVLMVRTRMKWLPWSRITRRAVVTFDEQLSVVVVAAAAAATLCRLQQLLVFLCSMIPAAADAGG